MLTYNSVKALRADQQYVGPTISNPQCAISLTAAGCFLDGAYLNEVSDQIVYECAPGGNGTWSLRMKGSENYLAVTSAAVLLTTVTDASANGALWRLSWSEGALVVKNAAIANRYLQYSTSSSGFCTLQTQRTHLSLYVRVPGEHLYTTSPQVRPALPCDGGEGCPGSGFLDMPAKGHWSHDAIDWAIVNKVTAGTSDTTFSPKDTCTRAQIVTFLWRAAGSPEPETTENPFADVPADKYYYKPVLWASENGITSGTGETTFSPNGSCTRAQVVTFLWRAEGSPPYSQAECPFRDVGENAWYRDAVLWALEHQITNGVSSICFDPNGTCTRAQVVTFLWRCMGGEP